MVYYTFLCILKKGLQQYSTIICSSQRKNKVILLILLLFVYWTTNNTHCFRSRLMNFINKTIYMIWRQLSRHNYLCSKNTYITQTNDSHIYHYINELLYCEEVKRCIYFIRRENCCIYVPNQLEAKVFHCSLKSRRKYRYRW